MRQVRRRWFLLLLTLLALAALTTDVPEPAPTRPLVLVSVAPELGIRRVTYRDSLSPGLAGFQSGVMVLISGAIEVYPGAWEKLPLLDDLGLYGTASHSADSTSRSVDGLSSFTATWTSWEAGLRLRGFFAGRDWGAVSVSYGGLDYQIGPGIPGVHLPAGLLQYWRPGLDLRIPLGRWSVTLSGGYRFVFSQNDIGSAFPHRTVGGIDAGGCVSLALLSALELRVGAHYIRYFYALNPSPGEMYVAGGALDEYGTIDIGVVLRE